ncbi:hypothetical protein CHS0354_017363 [Potamilus streckersoni]|uniref:C1q domain-containing protein n=1 Tax=Potamilus streckersoni TaxID=2493646 RepID=A0AAE0W7V0_9BIVA|nr:hypothetical protein CHS0354_017363 [Potamilus streckersoni]
MESLEARLSECTQKTALLEQSQWHQENEIRLQAWKLEQLESRGMDENESKVKQLENRLREALEITNKLMKEFEMLRLQSKLDNTSSGQLQACEKCEQDTQGQSLGHTSVRINHDPTSENGKISGGISTSSRMKRTSGLGKTTVAFAVTMSEWRESTLAVHQLLPFNKVLINDGNGFDSNLESFVCPVTGIYFFTATITSSNHKFEGSIVIDGVEKVIITTGEGPNFEQGSSSVVTHCSKGQRVYVFAHIGAVGQISETFSVFSGFLITDLESMSS